MNDECVASITQNGELTFLHAGRVTVTAKADDKDAVGGSLTLECPAETELILPEMLNEIGAEAFAGGGFEAVVVPEACRSIGARAFADNVNLAWVYMPDCMISIADDAFVGCGYVRFFCESENAAASYAAEHNIPYHIK